VYARSTTFSRRIDHVLCVIEVSVCLTAIWMTCYQVFPDAVLLQTAYAAEQANGLVEQSAKTGPGRLLIADERLTAKMPDHAVEVAQPIQVPVTITEPDVVTLTIVQHNDNSAFENKSADVP